MKTLLLSLACVTGLALTSQAQILRPQTANNVLVGGIAGAIIGDHNNHRAAEGALIGATAGLVWSALTEAPRQPSYAPPVPVVQAVPALGYAPVVAPAPVFESGPVPVASYYAPVAPAPVVVYGAPAVGYYTPAIVHRPYYHHYDRTVYVAPMHYGYGYYNRGHHGGGRAVYSGHGGHNGNGGHSGHRR